MPRLYIFKYEFGAGYGVVRYGQAPARGDNAEIGAGDDR
jgi:hypothetical protein